MQAVILAAGESTRTHPLTLTKPKPLLRVACRTIIEHNLKQLPEIVDEVHIVVGYKAEKIKRFLGENFEGLKIKYITQDERLGNADALKKAGKNIKGKFILMFGDDFYSKKDIERLLKYDNAILAKKVANPEQFGALKIKNDIFVKVIEKPKVFVSNLVNVGCFLFTGDIFDVLDKINLSQRNEYELTDAYNLLAQKKEIKVAEVKDYWLPITFPWNLLEANEYLLDKVKTVKNDKSKIEDGVRINGQLTVGAGTIVKSGVYVEGNVMIGKNCNIGPNCYLRKNVSIGDNCHIGQAVEIKNSIIGNNTNIAHLSYIGDSIIGDNVNFGAGTITANLRFDGKNVKSPVNGDIRDTGRKKFGVVIGDGCNIGINVSFYPGVKINPDSQILPGEIVKKDNKI